MEPKIRFKGFEGEWRKRTARNIVGRFRTGKLDANAMVPNGKYRFYTCAKDYFHIDTYAFDDEALLISGNGENVGYIHYYNGKFNAYQRTYVLTDFSQNILFIKSYLEARLKNRINKEKSIGNTPYIRLDTIRDMEISISQKMEEQKAIASYFTSLDSQISACTSRLASLKQMKAASLQAMFPQEGETVPKIRFKGFEGEWTWLKLGDISEQVKRKAPGNSTAPVMMISALNGFINQSEKYSDNNAGSSLVNYTLLKKGELSYNHGYSKTRNFGSCFNLLVEEARIPFVYHSFRLINDNDSFYAYYLNSGAKDKDLKRLVSSTARMDGLLNISFKNYMELSVPHPSLAEQQAIASYFTSLDRQISLQSQRLEKLKQIKSACLDKMFV